MNIVSRIRSTPYLETSEGYLSAGLSRRTVGGAEGPSVLFVPGLVLAPDLPVVLPPALALLWEDALAAPVFVVGEALAGGFALPRGAKLKSC